MTQRRPDGPLVTVTPEWIREARSKMAGLRINKSQLGRMLDPPVSRQAITDMLADMAPGVTRQSRLVPAVNAVLGLHVAVPTAPVHVDMLTARLVAAAQSLDEETRAELASIAERLARLHAKSR